MGRTPRLSGVLAIDASLRAQLAELRLIYAIDALPELSLIEVRALERAVQHRLPDAILALFAAQLAPLAQTHALALDKVMATTGRAHALGGRGDLVGLARDPGGTFLCWEKGEEGHPCPLHRYDPASRRSQETNLGAVLQTWIRRRREGRTGLPRFDVGLATTFHPRTVMPLPAGGEGRPVRHAKFGLGRVLVETGSGPKRKVKADFPGHGMKILQARFLEFLDQDDP